jgi:hypothetical protein
MQFLSEGRYVAVVVDGKLTFELGHRAWFYHGLAVVAECGRLIA